MTWSGDNAALGVSGSERSKPGSTVVTDMMDGVLLPANFRFLPRGKATSTSINGARDNALDQSRYERRIRKKFGYLLPFERKEIWRIKHDRQSHLYVAPPPEWSNLELPEGFFAPLPGVLSYKATDLARTYGTPYWAVFYADWTASVAATWLWEIYSSCRLWCLPKLIFLLIQELWPGLPRPVGGKHNRDELESWLNLMEKINWDDPRDVKSHWHCRGDPETRGQPCINPIFHGSRHPQCGDFVYIHPWKHVLISEAETEEYCRRGRPRAPRGHPTGYVELDMPVDFRERAFPKASRRDSSPRLGDSSSVPRSTDPDVISVCFRRDPVGTVNMDPIQEDVRELITQEFVQALGLFPRGEFPNQEEVCDRLTLIVNARLHGMKSPIFRSCVGRFLQDAGISHPPLTEHTDTKSFFKELIASRVRHARSREIRRDIVMTDVENTTVPSRSADAPINKDTTAVTTPGGDAPDAGEALQKGAVPANSGENPFEQVVNVSPKVTGEKRKTVGDKEPVLPPSKRLAESSGNGSSDINSTVAKQTKPSTPKVVEKATEQAQSSTDKSGNVAPDPATTNESAPPTTK